MHDLLPLLAQTETLSPQEIAELQAGAGIIFTMLIALVVLGIIFVIPLFFIYKKAGKPAWAAIVPFYNMYVYGQIVGRNPLFVVGAVILLPLLAAVPLVNMVASPLSFIFWAILSYDLALVFGGSQGLAIANIFFSPLINFYLAFSGNMQYRGPLHAADKRMLMEAPWIDPALGVQGVNPYSAHTVSSYGQQTPGVPMNYQPPAYDPAAGGTPQGGASGEGASMPPQPPTFTPTPSTPAGGSTPPSAGSQGVSTVASDWGAAPDALDNPVTPGEPPAAPPAAPPAGETPENPFETK